MNLEEWIGMAAGICTTAAVIPQIVKAIRTQEVGDVSAFMYVVLIMGVGLWAAYGIITNDVPIIITNGISVFLNSFMLYMLWRQGRRT